MHPTRLKTHHQAPLKPGQPILYWLQHTQRIDQNYALYHAIALANQNHTTLTVVFVLTPHFKEAYERQYAFMLEGLKELFEALEDRGIDARVTIGSFEDVISDTIAQCGAFVLDKNYIRHLRETRSHLIEKAIALDLHTVEVESDLIVPIEVASNKLEYAARTIRPKIQRLLPTYLTLFEEPTLIHRTATHEAFFDLSLDEQLKRIKADPTVPRSAYFNGGERAAMRRFETFMASAIDRYEDANDPALALTSKLSPYLHFAQISPVRMAMRLQDYLERHPKSAPSIEGYLEQLTVRRELAFNFTYYEPQYDTFEGMTYAWAYQTMQDHQDDRREYLYTEDDYVAFKTHDPYFNAAMKEMVLTGYMHNYMRMYWAKKIIEWSATYEEAYTTILTLNNRYFIDGSDPNSYTGVAWCFGQHDRPWTERPILGKLRYMNAAGLKRKFDIERYVTWCENLT